MPRIGRMAAPVGSEPPVLGTKRGRVAVRGIRSGLQPPNPLIELLVCRMRVDGRAQGAGVPRESLCKVEVLCGAVDVRDRRVAEAVEGVDRLESRGGLPFPEHELDPPEGDA